MFQHLKTLLRIWIYDLVLGWNTHHPRTFNLYSPYSGYIASPIVANFLYCRDCGKPVSGLTLLWQLSISQHCFDSCRFHEIAMTTVDLTTRLWKICISQHCCDVCVQHNAVVTAVYLTALFWQSLTTHILISLTSRVYRCRMKVMALLADWYNNVSSKQSSVLSMKDQLKPQNVAGTAAIKCSVL